MSETNVGDLVAAFLEACGVTAAYGVISIHNMPILDAIGRRGRIRFVTARGEAGAANMADAHARVGATVGVCVTSTGTGAGNAAGALVEAQTAGSPILHLTGQIDTPGLDRGRSMIHEARAQPEMLKAVSKAFFRIWSAETALGVLQEAVRTALAAPRGPVSVEIPIDVQKAPAVIPATLAPAPLPVAPVDAASVSRIADRIAAARRPLLWCGGGARHAGEAVRRLAALGVGVVTSVNGRGVLPEDDPMTLGAFNMLPPVEAFYRTCDLLVVAGSRLRGNETRNYAMALPRPIVQIDAEAGMRGRAYPVDDFACGDAAATLDAIAQRLVSRFTPDAAFRDDLAAARRAAEDVVREGLGPYARLVEELQTAMPRNVGWVRDITISNSTWGNRLLRVFDAASAVHAVGGGIGQGLPMAIGAALGAKRKAVCLSGDGGLALCMAELATLAQERADVTLLVMNDQGYGVIRNIQDAQYGKRRYFTEIFVPELGALAAAMKIPHWRVAALDAFAPTIAAALATRGPTMVEVDMTAIGPFARAFAGPPAVHAQPKKVPA
jgi:acetolactate synthase-1/2/3 large subunit